jgi:hypothetical protein
LDDDLVLGHIKNRGDLISIVPHTLTAGVDVEATLGRHRQRRFRLQECVLDALGLEDLAHDMGAAVQRRVDITAGVGRGG